MTQKSSLNEEEIKEQDSIALAHLLYDIYQNKKLEEKQNVSSNI